MRASTVDSSSANLVDIDETFLPIGQMRQIARVTRLAGETIEGEVDLGPTHWVFPQHFPDDPIFPGTLMIEAAGQLVALWAWAAGQRGRPRLLRASAEFHNPVGPTSAHLRLQAEVRRKRHLHFATIQVRNAETRVATAEVVLAVLPPAP
jgi:3-hydroxymyristoyl/3-hydroxydecanoyl-(acyl carrier protein) dehydratase